MKIFTWMHRKLHTHHDYSMISCDKADAFSNSVKEVSGGVMCGKETEGLLNGRGHVTLVDVLGGWPDAIFAIGTFGLDPLNPIAVRDGHSVSEEEFSIDDDDDGEAEEEEEVQLSPVAVTAFKHECGAAELERHNVEREMMRSQPLMGAEAEVEDDLHLPFLEAHRNRPQRITLADLFYGDAALAAASSAATEKCGEPKISADTAKIHARGTKHVRSIAKKLMPWKSEDSRPTTKLHGLVKKMLKRKIHPELDRKIHGAINGSKASKIEATDSSSIEINGANESLSLLQGVVLEL